MSMGANAFLASACAPGRPRSIRLETHLPTDAKMDKIDDRVNMGEYYMAGESDTGGTDSLFARSLHSCRCPPLDPHQYGGLAHAWTTAVYEFLDLQAETARHPVNASRVLQTLED